MTDKPPTDRRVRWRDQHIRTGKCRHCSKPVAIKSNGQPAKLCDDHLKSDRERKA